MAKTIFEMGPEELVKALGAINRAHDENIESLVKYEMAIKDYEAGKTSELISDRQAYLNAKDGLSCLEARERGYSLMGKVMGRGLL